jgi:hypothetical protein
VLSLISVVEIEFSPRRAVLVKSTGGFRAQKSPDPRLERGEDLK